MKAYHISKDYKIGDNLESLYEKHDHDEESAIAEYMDRWPEAGVEMASYHIMYVHFYETLEEAEIAEIDGDIYEVDLDDYDVEVDDLEFPHPIVRGIIHAEHIKRVREREIK